MVRTGTREHGTVSRELGTRLWPVEGRAVGDSFLSRGLFAGIYADFRYVGNG
jgi:uncharacterized protein (UPF0210 family)